MTSARSSLHRTASVIGVVALLLVGGLAVTASASTEHCPDHTTSVKVEATGNPATASELVTVQDQFGTLVDVWVVIDGLNVSFYLDDDGAYGAPVEVDFCMKAANFASGMRTGSEGTVDFENIGGEIPDISYVTVYLVHQPTGAILIAKTGVGGGVLTAADGVAFIATAADETVYPMPELPGEPGFFCVQGLPFGEYTVTETSLPAGYLPLLPIPVTVDAAGTCATVDSISVVNSAAPADIYIEKEDSDGVPLDGVTFRLVGPDGYDETAVTVAGSAEFLQVPLGTGYTLSETLPAGWSFTSATVTIGDVTASITLPYTFDIGLGPDESGQQFLFTVVNDWDGAWCSPGFWRNNPLAFQEAVAAGEPGADPYALLYADYFTGLTVSTKALRDGATTNPTLWQILQSPQWYGGGAFNNVGDLLSEWHPDVDFGGVRTDGTCELPADASGIRG